MSGNGNRVVALAALALRVETAEGPDRVLDAAVELALTGGSALDLAYATDPMDGETVAMAVERTLRPPNYTSSLDAALPEALKHGFIASLGTIAADGLPGCCICTSTDPVKHVWGVGFGRDEIGRLARATIAAALRAQAEGLM